MSFDDNLAARMPVLFVGHGSPMNAIEDNDFSRAWLAVGQALPRPRAILCISAHWETEGPWVTAMPHPRLIRDFYGFPRELFTLPYPAAGSPELARLVRQTVRCASVGLDEAWGLDHGAWSVLCRLFPQADIPVVQLSLDRTQTPAFHSRLARELRSLRDQGILVVSSGNIVHNLGEIVWDDVAYAWATEFDSQIKSLIEAGDHEAIINYPQLGEAARLSVPTNEHFLPLLYALALQEPGEKLEFFAEKVTLGSMSMRSFRMG
jgi:4,5-DOPA dioxygenase extradiol